MKSPRARNMEALTARSIPPAKLLRAPQLFNPSAQDRHTHAISPQRVSSPPRWLRAALLDCAGGSHGHLLVAEERARHLRAAHPLWHARGAGVEPVLQYLALLGGDRELRPERHELAPDVALRGVQPEADVAV